MHRTECCVNCKHYYVASGEIPCHGCINSSHWEPNSCRVFDVGKIRSTRKRISIRDEVDNFNPEDYKQIWKNSVVFAKSRQCGFTMANAKYMEALIEQINKGEKNRMIKITIGTALKNADEKITGVIDREIFHGITKIEAVAKYLKIHTGDAKKLVFIEEEENWKEFTRI